MKLIDFFIYPLKIEKHLKTKKQKMELNQQSLSNQTFPVIYNKDCFMVDPNCMMKSSAKFKELIDPLMSDNKITDLHLTISPDLTFSVRSVKNFLQLCQNLPSDVQNSEMEEVCEIAKLFKADQIYNTGVTFIHNNIDPNFNVSNDKYEGKNCLIIEAATNMIHHAGDLEDLSFSDDEGDSPKIESNQPNTNSNIKTEKIKSIIYEIVCQHRPMALTDYLFVSLGQPMFIAKKKENIIYIGKGSEVHISKPETHIAQVIQNNDNTNIIHFQSQKIDFAVNFVGSGKPNHLSIQTSFTNSNNKKVNWSPKTPQFDAQNNRYYLNYNGEYHHSPINSKKNIVLQNERGKTTFIVRKMGMYNYEVECMPLVDPLIAFIIALSDVIGPHNDPFSDVEI